MKATAIFSHTLLISAVCLPLASPAFSGYARPTMAPSASMQQRAPLLPLPAHDAPAIGEVSNPFADQVPAMPQYQQSSYQQPVQQAAIQYQPQYQPRTLQAPQSVPSQALAPTTPPNAQIRFQPQYQPRTLQATAMVQTPPSYQAAPVAPQQRVDDIIYDAPYVAPYTATVDMTPPDEPHVMQTASMMLSPWYASLRGEYVMMNDWDHSFSSGGSTFSGQTEFDGGYGVGIAVGYQFTPNFRAEAEATYRNSDVDSTTLTQRTGGAVVGTTTSNTNGSFESTTVMANGYIDLPLPSYPAFAPYIGGGIGWLFQHDGAEENAFAYQAMAGARYFVTDQTALNIEYRYFDTDDLFDDPTLGEFSPESHIIGAGVSVYF